MSHCTYAATPEDVQKMYSTVGKMDNCEGIFASWITDPAAIQAALPAPLKMMVPVVTSYSLLVHDANFSTPYREAALIIPALYEGVPGLYPISLLIDGSDNACFVGRDQLGMPKKHAAINLHRNGDTAHTDITRLGAKLLDLDIEVGEYNDPATAAQIFGDTSKPMDGLQYFFKYEMGQDDKARIYVDNVRLLSYRGVMTFATWEPAALKSATLEPSDSDPWAMFPVAKPVGAGYTKMTIDLLGTQKETPLEATDELVGKIILSKYDSPQFGRPSRML